MSGVLPFLLGSCVEVAQVGVCVYMKVHSVHDGAHWVHGILEQSFFELWLVFLWKNYCATRMLSGALVFFRVVSNIGCSSRVLTALPIKTLTLDALGAWFLSSAEKLCMAEPCCSLFFFAGYAVCRSTKRV